MGSLGELLAVNERQALEFFVVGLQDVAETTVSRDELLYNASVLAHYTQVSTGAAVDMPTPSTLTDVFDQFVLGAAVAADSLMTETAAAQCLWLAGFFEDQMRGRHNIRWYAELGASCFSRAAAQEPSPRKACLLHALACHFEPWRRRYARLSRELRAQPYLLATPHTTKAPGSDFLM